MKKRRITALALSVALVMGTVALAADAEKSITVTPMTMTINGQAVTPTKSNGAAAEVFAYDGATYAPIRYLCELLGIQVEWDKANPNVAELVSDKLTLPAGGSYTGSAQGFGGSVTATITVSGDRITACTLTGDGETPAIGGVALEELQAQVLAAGSADIDGVSGATYTSKGAKEAVQAALDAAKGGEKPVEKALKAGTYTATAHGHHSDITLEMKVSANAIENVTVVECGDNMHIGDAAVNTIPPAIVEHQSILVDTVTGATFTSRAILEAATDCIRQAGGDQGVKAFSVKVEKPQVTKKDLTADYDVVVVGSGLAGMCAALAAQEEGVSVAILEKLSYYGGISQTSAGAFKYPNNGSTPEESDYYNYLLYKSVGLMQDDKAKVNGYPDLEACAVMVETSATMEKWFANFGVTAINNASYPDDNGRFDMGSIIFNDGVHVEPDNTAAAIETMMERFLSKGGTLYLETPAVSLVTDAKGAVIGVKAEGPEANYTFNCGAAVLCCGGFGSDPEMLAELAPAFKGETVGATGVGNTGDGIRMAREIGAAVYDDGYLMGGSGHTFVTDAERIMPFADAVTPKSSLYVNPMGQRVNSEDPVSYTSAITYCNPDAEDYYWAIMNEEVANSPYYSNSYNPIEENIRGQYIDLVNQALEEGKPGVYKAETIEELANLIGIVPTTLSYTLSHYNNLCEAGEDTDLFKNPQYLIPMKEGPWYALKADMEFFGTVGGIVTDANAAVLKEDGSVISGLYAAGETSNHKVMNMSYSGGVSVCENVVFGRIAGEQAAAKVKSK